jgi:hypothetical protein
VTKATEASARERFNMNLFLPDAPDGASEVPSTA